MCLVYLNLYFFTEPFIFQLLLDLLYRQQKFMCFIYECNILVPLRYIIWGMKLSGVFSMHVDWFGF